MYGHADIFQNPHFGTYGIPLLRISQLWLAQISQVQELFNLLFLCKHKPRPQLRSPGWRLLPAIQQTGRNTILVIVKKLQTSVSLTRRKKMSLVTFSENMNYRYMKFVFKIKITEKLFLAKLYIYNFPMLIQRIWQDAVWQICIIC